MTIYPHEMNLLKFTLATQQVTGKHTGEKIKDEIQSILRTFQIPQKDIVLVTDSGSNMKRAADLLNMQNHRSLGHGLHNLVTVDGIQNTDEVLCLINKCKKIVKHLRYRAPQLEAAASKEQRDLLSSFVDIDINHSDDEDSSIDVHVEEPLTSSGTGAPPTIKTSTPTRWHSMLMMLKSINHNANHRPIRDIIIIIISPYTFPLLGHGPPMRVQAIIHHAGQVLTSFFNKFKTIVEILSSESQTTINLALIFKSEIRRLLEECDDDEPVILEIRYVKVTPPTPPPSTSKSRRAAADSLTVGAHI
ncbi:uncharacterized protein LOC123703967 [Colias croceus]|uniref:uncharacterized protein LOC123703967 n=1 Tax=Colias crocea TaxID=72248 RepID=UPI001E27EBB7|nr:uncharacterized protein LOC123703967 [Colias croceus]